MTSLKSAKKILIIVAGPTAVGKTQCAISLALNLKTEIISADSRQIYREMSIGTAKPTLEERDLVRHHFIDFLTIGNNYNAGKYGKDVREFLDIFYRNHDICLMTGGTGLYINAVTDGLDEFPEVPDHLLSELQSRLQKLGIEYLQNELKTLDPEYFLLVDQNNPHRLIRALSVCIASGRPYSSFLHQPKEKPSFEPIFILLNRDREELYERINQRVDQMVGSGLINEVRSLLAYRKYRAMQTVGYRELLDYFDQKTSLESALDKIRQNTRNYAKRQLTWFNNDGRYTRFHPEDLYGIKAWIDLKIAEIK